MNKVLIAGMEPKFCLEVEKCFERKNFFVVSSNSKNSIFKKLNEFTFVIIMLDFFDEQLIDFVLKSKIGLKFHLIFLVRQQELLKENKKETILNADDFVILPTTAEEILLRVKKIIRNSSLNEGTIETKYLKIDLKNHELIVAGKRKRAAPKEIELLYKLAANENLLFTRKQLLLDVWGYRYFAKTRTVDVHIKRLRTKLKSVNNLCRIETVWGVGYVFKTTPN